MDNPEHQIIRFYGFSGNFGLQHTFQESIAPKSLEINQDNLRMKFSAFDVYFNGSRIDPLGLRKPVHKGIK